MPPGALPIWAILHLGVAAMLPLIQKNSSANRHTEAFCHNFGEVRGPGEEGGDPVGHCWPGDDGVPAGMVSRDAEAWALIITAAFVLQVLSSFFA